MNRLFVGRAATAIYLVLKTNCNNREVILPANICYAAVYPVIYSGNRPVFVDIDLETGNANLEAIKKRVSEKTGAIIFPYMYGNISKDILELKDFCKERRIILIEDCASAMGANIDGVPVGNFGDYAIFSTGHAKIVDLGNGGILTSPKDLNEIIVENEKLPLYDNFLAEKSEEFSKEYRRLRNLNDTDALKTFFAKDYHEQFIYKIDDDFQKKIESATDNLTKEVKNRLNNAELFKKMLKISPDFQIFEFADGSAPWRFNILFKSLEQRNNLVRELLTHGLFVSDWYPCIGKIFSEESFPNAERMESEILNFSLTEDENYIRTICDIINENTRDI